ncbi:MAG: heme ABC transporter ATP-binding protein [Solitalea-like symbiont of Acarus siro]
MLKVKNISYNTLIKNISFSIRSGEILGILGANGAGKSTLLKLLCKEHLLTKGDIILNEKNINDYSIEELAKTRAVLSQKYSTNIPFSVEELVIMGRYPHFTNTPKNYDISLAHQVMEETKILHLKNRNYALLSGGEQQQVQVARMLTQVYDMPNAYLFLDEPTSNLDIFRQRTLLQLLKKFSQRKFTIICILHDINLASIYTDKILFLQQGQAVAFGPPSKVITCDIIHKTYKIPVELMMHKTFQCPLVIPT